MNNALRMLQLFCILLLIGFAAGCGNDDPVVQPPVQPQSAGTIGIYTNPEGTMQTVTDLDGPVTVYVVHAVDNGATGSSFRVEAPAGWTLGAVESQFAVTIGDVEEGISIGYGACCSGAVHLMTLTYDSPGATPAGATFRVLPHTTSPDYIQVVDCDFNVLDNGRGIETPVVVPQEAQGGSNPGRDRPASEE